MTQSQRDLWGLTVGGGTVDPTQLTQAIVRQLDSGEPDFRTRLLIRDSLDALARHWGRERVDAWLDRALHSDAIRRIWQEELGEVAFPSLAWRVMTPTRPETILQFLRDLGTRIRTPVALFIGGSAALILPGMLTRSTDDIDVVDELPPGVRGEHALLEELLRRYGLRLAHFQSHYLPAGWQGRASSLGRLGEIDAYLLDPYDVFLSKVFSQRTKDQDDLRHLAPQLDKDRIVRRLMDTTRALQSEPKLRAVADRNWYVLYAEPLPAPPAQNP